MVTIHTTEQGNALKSNQASKTATGGTIMSSECGINAESTEIALSHDANTNKSVTSFYKSALSKLQYEPESLLYTETA